jgi:hypothetical protein
MSFINYLKGIKIAPRCIDCKHYLIPDPVRGANIYATAKCTRTIYRSSNTGELKFEYAYIARSDVAMCGPKGSKFVPLIEEKFK